MPFTKFLLTRMKKGGNAIYKLVDKNEKGKMKKSHWQNFLTKMEREGKAMTKSHDRNKKEQRTRTELKEKQEKRKWKMGSSTWQRKYWTIKNTENTEQKQIPPDVPWHQPTHIKPLKPASISSAHPHSTTTKKPAACRHPERLKREKKNRIPRQGLIR